MMHFIVERQRVSRLKNYSKDKGLVKLDFNTYHLYYYPMIEFMIKSVDLADQVVGPPAGVEGRAGPPGPGGGTGAEPAERADDAAAAGVQRRAVPQVRAERQRPGERALVQLGHQLRLGRPWRQAGHRLAGR
jgi:hypothetical protein